VWFRFFSWRWPARGKRAGGKDGAQGEGKARAAGTRAGHGGVRCTGVGAARQHGGDAWQEKDG
jgi:hypothetical protein